MHVWYTPRTYDKVFDDLFVFQDQKALFNCNENEGHHGQFVYLRDDREDKEYFGLCEVEVFEHKGKFGLMYSTKVNLQVFAYIGLLLFSYLPSADFQYIELIVRNL